MRHPNESCALLRRGGAQRMRRILMSLVAAVCLACAGSLPAAADTPANRILPDPDATFVTEIQLARQSAQGLEDFLESVISTNGGDRAGRRHKVSGSDLVLVRTRIGQLTTLACNLTDRLGQIEGSLFVKRVEDAKLRKKLVACIKKGLASAKATAKKLDAKLNPKPKNPSDPPPPPKKVPGAGALKNKADKIGDALSDARDALFGRKDEPEDDSAPSSQRPGFRNSFPKKKSRLPTRDSDSRGARPRTRRSIFGTGPGGRKSGSKNGYVGIGAVGDLPQDDGFYVGVLPLSLSGDVEAGADVGLFSDKQSVRDAAGDREIGCLEVAISGGAPGEAFLSLCGRVDAQRGGYEAFVGSPQGERPGTFLPGVEVAELRMTIVDGELAFDVRDAAVRGDWTRVDTVTAPPQPLTFSLRVVALGTGDEVGFDNVFVRPLD